jgi:O-antigen biosynthesis protein
VRSMEASDADICTAFHTTFYEEHVPADESLGYVQYFPLGGGGGLDLGLIYDTFGDANAMVRREVFDRIGFQIEDYGYAHQDWEFFARAALAGLKIRVIPEPLYWYRSSPKSMFRASHWYENVQPILAAYRKHGFAGLEYVYHLALSANTATSEKESYKGSLYYSVSNERHLELAKLDPESDEAISMLAEIAAAEGRDETALSLSGQHGREGIRQPRGVSPLHQRRAREWTEAERRSARLVTKYPSLLPLLLFPPHPEGLFLRPSAEGNVVATLSWVFPPFARGVVATVEIAHEEASPFEFAMALSRPDEVLRWAGDQPPGCLAFSGWLKVDRPFKLRELSMEMKALVRMHLSINLAVRLPEGSEPSPANAFWRKLVITWDR